MLLARREDFEPNTAQERTAALYASPDGSYYRDYPFFQTRVDSLKGRFTPNNQKLAVWGCGFGYLVAKCVEAGYDAFGYDASQYAIDRGKQILPSIANRLFLRNATVGNDMTPARRDAGLQGAQRFALLVTEDLYTCLNDAEVSTATTNLRGICSSNLLHIVSPNGLGENQDPRINWKTLAQWRAILTPPDLVVDPEGNA